MPTPESGEKQDDYISRCIPIVIHEGTAKDPSQAAAICHSMWDKHQEGKAVWLELEEVRKICPTCAEKMEQKGWTKLNVALLEMPEFREALMGEIDAKHDYHSAKMERCLGHLRDQGFEEGSAHAICYATLGDEANTKALEEKVGARHNAKDQQALQEIHDAAITLGANCPKSDAITEIPILGKNCLKAIGETDDELRVGNYIALYGGRDLEGIASEYINGDGSRGTYFTPETEFTSTYTKTGRLYVDWEHGMGQEVDKTKAAPDEDEMLGYVDWPTAKSNDLGLWVERVLYRRNQYMQYLEPLIKQGLIGTSTRAVRRNVKIEPDGKITRWPIKSDTLTVTPMEPRMMTENIVRALKALGVELPQAPEGEPEAGGDPAASKGSEAAIQSNTENTEITKMEITPEIQTMIDAASKKAADEAVKSMVATLPATNTGGVQVIKDESDQDFESEGKFLIAVKNAALGRGYDKRLNGRKAPTGMSEGVPSDGGYLLQQQYAAGLLQRMYNVGNILSRISTDPIGPNSNSMAYNGLDETARTAGYAYGGIRAYWVAEGATITASKPKFRQVELKLKKIAALCHATDEQLEDSTNLEAWLTRTVPEALRFQVEDAVYEGNGVGKPLGIMSSGCLISVYREELVKIHASDIVNMWARRWAGVNDYVWLINQDAVGELLQCVLGTYFPVYLPAGGLSAAPYATILGKPVFEIEYAATLGTTGDIMLASLSQYQAIDKGGVKAARSLELDFLTDETAFRFTYRIDGEPLWDTTLTPLHGSNTQSPFVVLCTCSSS